MKIKVTDDDGNASTLATIEVMVDETPITPGSKLRSLAGLNRAGDEVDMRRFGTAHRLAAPGRCHANTAHPTGRVPVLIGMLR